PCVAAPSAIGPAPAGLDAGQRRLRRRSLREWCERPRRGTRYGGRSVCRCSPRPRASPGRSRQPERPAARISSGVQASALLPAQQIALAPYGLDAPTGDLRARQLAADVADVHVETAVMLRIAAMQHLLVEEGLAEHFFRRAVEQLQQSVLGRGESDPVAFMFEIAAAIVEAQRVVVR